MAGTRIYTYFSLSLPLLLLLLYISHHLLLARPSLLPLDNLPQNLSKPIVWLTVLSNPGLMPGFQTKPHSVLRHVIAGLSSFHGCQSTHTTSRKVFTSTVKGYEYLCPLPTPWILRGVLPSDVLPNDGHSVITLNLTLPSDESENEINKEETHQSPVYAPCTLTPIGRTVQAVFHRNFMSVTETTTQSEWPVNGPGGLVLNPSLLNVVGIKMGAWLGREVEVKDGEVWIWEEGGGGAGEGIGESFKNYLETLGANVRIYRGNYAELPSLVVNEEEGGTRALRKGEEGGFVRGHVIDGKIGSNGGTLRFDYFLPSSPVDTSKFSGFTVSNLGAVCVLSSSSPSSHHCDDLFTSIYGKLTSTTPPNLLPSPTVIQNGHDYSDRAVIVKASKWGDVVRDANQRSLRVFKEARAGLEGVKKYLDENSNVEIPKTVEDKYNLVRSLLSSAADAHVNQLYALHSELSTLGLKLVKELEAEHTLMPLLHFPFEHKIAVLAPIWAPLLLPILIGGVKEFKRYKQLTTTKAKAQ